MKPKRGRDFVWVKEIDDKLYVPIEDYQLAMKDMQKQIDKLKKRRINLDEWAVVHKETLQRDQFVIRYFVEGVPCEIEVRKVPLTESIHAKP